MGKPLPPVDHRISLPDAAKKTKKYKAKKEHKKPFPVGAFHRSAFETILAQPGCVGIRAYPAEQDDGAATMILVGVDVDGNDMVDGELAQDLITCPFICSDGNALNQG
jgi:hypothetical protein